MASNRTEQIRRRLVPLALAAALMVPAQGAFAARSAEDRPSAGRMATDLVVARPIGAVMTVAGAAAFVVSLPFSLLGGNVGEAAGALVVEPARQTFMRCLGCTRAGEQRAAAQNDDD